MSMGKSSEDSGHAIALAAVAVAVGLSADEAWSVALRAAHEVSEEAAFKAAFRYAGDIVYGAMDR